MNATSLTFALVMASLVAATGVFIRWGAAKYGGWSRRRLAVTTLLTIAGTAFTAVAVYRVDVRMRGITLFEVVGPWEETGGRIWPVNVEHPGVEHTLTVYPFAEGFESAGHAVTLRTRLAAAGGPVLIEETRVHETTRRSGRSASGLTWEPALHTFTPDRAGEHEFSVVSVDGIVPNGLHLRITDPEKRDGVRAPGY